MTDLVVAASPDEIANLPREHRGEVITHALIESKQWLAVATKGTDPTPIAEFKAWAATVAEMTRQKGLAAEIQADALEMVRRAERGIGVAIRNGQEAGEIAKNGERLNEGLPNEKTSPATFFSGGGEEYDTYCMTDDVTDRQFDAALTESRTEGKPSRANVVRKIKGLKNDGLTPVEKLVKIRELAPTGRTSGQIGAEVGCSENHVRHLARKNGITITADKVMNKTRRLDHTRFVNETVTALEALASGLEVLNLEQVDPTQLVDWATSLTDSLKKLSGLARRIKEMTRE